MSMSIADLERTLDPGTRGVIDAGAPTRLPEAVYASEVLGLIENDDGTIIGLEQGSVGGEADADVFGAERLNEAVGDAYGHGAAATLPGDQLLYERADQQGRSMGVVKQNRLKIEKNGQPIAQFLMIWRIAQNQWVRVPATQVVQCLNKRGDKGEKLFSLRAPAVLPEKPVACMFADEVGCESRFANRSHMLNHASKRHPALWAARSQENDAERNDMQRATVEQLISQGKMMQDALAAQSKLMAVMANALGARVPTTPEEAVEMAADVPDEKFKKQIKTKLDVIPREPSPIEGA
jgi:hypothetical protein